nr:glutathione S-transferase [Hyphomonas sp.]
MLRVYGRASSINVRKVLWTCDELCIAFEREDWGAGFRSTREAEFLALNPKALIPVVIDGNTVLTESNAICRFIASKHGSELLPADPARRAEVEAWMDWMISDLNMAWRYAVQALVRKRPGYDNPVEVQKSVDEWNGLMRDLDAQLAIRPDYLCDAFTLADVPVGLAIHRWLNTPIARIDLPNVMRYYNLLQTRPAFARYANDAFN